MSFKSLLEKYKNGEVNEEERKVIEAELEKYEAIEGYYVENKLFPLDQGGNHILSGEENYNGNGKKTNDEILNINKVINQRLRKVVIASVVTVILLYISIFFVLSPFVGMFYYNPSKNSISENRPDMEFDLRAITELNIPGYTMPGAKRIDSEGFGSYSITYYSHDLFTKQLNTNSLRIRRSSHYGSTDGLIRYRFNFAFNAVSSYALYERGYFEGGIKNMTRHLEALSQVAYVSAYFAFDEDITLEEFAHMKTNYKELDFQWVGVRTHDRGKIPEGRPNHLTGFNPNPDNGSASDYKPDPEKYPTFNMLDHILEARDGTPQGWAKSYEEHYRTLLNYVLDREDAVRAFDPYPNKNEYYKESLNYIDDNGLNVFGVLVYGEAAELLKFIEENDFLTIEIDRVLPSKPNLY